jgi:hypothetical protein
MFLISLFPLFIQCDSPTKAKPGITNPFVGDFSLPQIISPDIISSVLPEFASTYSPTTKLMVFNRMPEDRSRIDLFYTRWADTIWTKPKSINLSINEGRNIDPFWHEQTLYYCRETPKDSLTGYDIWTSEWNGTNFSKPVKLPDFINTVLDEVFVSVADNKNIYFARFGEDRSVSIFKSVYIDGTYQPPALQQFDNDSARITNPSIAPDESIMIFSATGIAGFGSADLYIATNNGPNQWSNITNLGPSINSSQAEFAPFISDDFQLLFYTSERPGMVSEQQEGRPPGDIYAVALDQIIK